MQKFSIEITDTEYWRVQKGYSKNNGKELNRELLISDLYNQIRLNHLLISGDLLVNFGKLDLNNDISLLVKTETFSMNQNVFEVSGNKDSKKKLKGVVIPGIRIRSNGSALPYRSRL